MSVSYGARAADHLGQLAAHLVGLELCLKLVHALIGLVEGVDLLLVLKRDLSALQVPRSSRLCVSLMTGLL